MSSPAVTSASMATSVRLSSTTLPEERFLQITGKTVPETLPRMFCIAGDDIPRRMDYRVQHELPEELRHVPCTYADRRDEISRFRCIAREVPWLAMPMPIAMAVTMSVAARRMCIMSCTVTIGGRVCVGAVRCGVRIRCVGCWFSRRRVIRGRTRGWLNRVIYRSRSRCRCRRAEYSICSRSNRRKLSFECSAFCDLCL